MVFLILLIGSQVFADPAWFPVGKPNAKTSWMIKSDCESAEEQECFDVEKCPLDECGLQDVDDLGRPKFSKAEVEACSGEAACVETLSKKSCIEGVAYIDADYTEVYCAVPNGYHKKKDLKVDPVKKAERDATKAQEETERNAKENKLKNIKRDLKDCVATMKKASPTAAEQRACILAIVKKLAADDVPSSDL